MLSNEECQGTVTLGGLEGSVLGEVKTSQDQSCVVNMLMSLQAHRRWQLLTHCVMDIQKKP